MTPDLSGTLINYYATCPREAWLYSRQIHADQEEDNITMGRALAEMKDESKAQHMFSHLHFDKIGKQRGHILVTEYKKTMRNPEAARMQLLFYMYLLKNGLRLKEVNGKVIAGKQSVYVEGDEANFSELESVMEKIGVLLEQPSPPPFEPLKWCGRCGYRHYCGAE